MNPIRWICKGCGFPLGEYKMKPWSDFSTTEGIIRRLKRCPGCGRKLEKPSVEDILIRKADKE